MTKQPEFQPFWFQQTMDLEEDYRNGGCMLTWSTKYLPPRIARKPVG
ncbi:protein of unknown function, might belong to FAD-dependent oxidoreductase [Moritella yayanosii]|uniref:Uncharacterized protein n=1 Tax=Moritella yayanosii TaxID=69539 RepID=A0A330LQ17_9GAMM|nr:protein of unknown function, might belong to FAD-dependent oxidoreductase [Moritella yayanosii]